MLDLAQVLDLETANIALSGPKEVYEAANKVWDVVLTALQVQDEEQRVTATKDLNRELSEFVKRARADLGV